MKTIIKLIGLIRFPLFKGKELGAKSYLEALNIIKEGDIILSRSGGYFTNILNPSKKYKHAGLITSISESSAVVTEAITSGVVNTELFDFFEGKTDIAIMRLKCNDFKCHVKRALGLVGSKYDFEFLSNNKKFYCFELIEYAIRPLVNIKKIVVLYKSSYLAQSFLDNDMLSIVGEFHV